MTQHVRPVTHLKLGILWMLLASLLTAVTALLVKRTSQFTSVEVLLFGRSCVGFAFMLAWMLLFYKKESLSEALFSRDWRMHLVRGCSALASLFLLFYSLKFLDLADALVLTNTIPIFVPIVLFIWKKVPIQHQLWWGISLSFLGIILLIQPGYGTFQWAASIALLAGLAGSISTSALRYAHYKNSVSLSLFYYFFVTVVISGLATLPSFQTNWNSLNFSLIGWLVAIGLSGFGTQICYTLATKYAPVRITTPLLYVSVILGVIFDWWIWGRSISLLEGIGIVCVIAGACLVVYLYPKEEL